MIIIPHQIGHQKFNNWVLDDKDNYLTATAVTALAAATTASASTGGVLPIARCSLKITIKYVKTNNYFL